MANENTKIVTDFDKKQEYLEKNISNLKKTDIEKALSDLRDTIAEYKPEDNDKIEQNIKQNRVDWIVATEKMLKRKESEADAGRKVNGYFGETKLIQMTDCVAWIMKNTSEIQAQIDRRKAFVGKFPYESGNIDLDIEGYSIGAGGTPFCWYLENNTPGAMGQKSSLDYYLYWSDKDKSYAKRNGLAKECLDEKAALRLFESIKSNLEKMFLLVEEDRIEDIETERAGLELPKANILQKILFMYFPDKFFGYYAQDYVEKIAAMLNISSGGDVFFINNLITSNVLNALSKTGNSAEHNSMGFTVYLWHVWNDYIRKSVGAG